MLVRNFVIASAHDFGNSFLIGTSFVGGTRIGRLTVRTTQVATFVMIATAFFSSTAQAFKPGIHEDISEEALRATTTTVDGDRTITFTDDAIDDIRDANFYTDVGPGFFVGAYHFTEEFFTASSSRLVNLREEVIALITAPEPDGDEAREKLGTAFHTLQDFYAHSNWVERGMAGIYSALGQDVLANPSPAIATCPGDPEVLPADGGPILTTAYYEGLLGCGPIRTPGKCYHGGPGGCDGINKDYPGRPFHFTARDRAVSASRNYLDQILTDPRVASNDPAKKSLMGITAGTLAMVIDDTGSMGAEINQVKAQVTQIVNRVVGTDDEPEEYLLVRFGDPDVGPPSATSDSAQFLDRVNALFPSGGGDCPELANTALLQAIGRSKRGSSLFLFTDASSKDHLLALSVIAAASLKGIGITPLLTGSCSPIDPAFVNIAEQTGGQLFFLNPSELGQVFGLVEPQLTGDFVTIARAQRTVGGPAEEFSAPIDSTVSQAIFSLSSTDPLSMSVVRPDGTTVLSTDPGVTITNLSGGVFVSVESPEPGTWRAIVAGTGVANVAVQGTSPLSFPTFQFVELVNPIHQAYSPLTSQPVRGIPTTALAALRGPVSSASFEFVDLAGNRIQSYNLTLGDPNAALDEYVGSAVLPTQPFRIAAVGMDTAGSAFRRLFPPVIISQPVEIAVNPDSLVESLSIGETTTLRFTVTNYGNAGTFVVRAVEGNGFASRVDPISLTLGMEEHANIEVDLTVPDDTPPNTVALLTVSVSSAADPEVGNTTAVELPVEANHPPDCSAASGTLVQLWPPSHQLEAIDLASTLGVTDPEGDTVTFSVNSITQDEPVFGEWKREHCARWHRHRHWSSERPGRAHGLGQRSRL